jgi:hypothetical protein
VPRIAASTTRADGTPVARFDIPYFVTVEEAARALAYVYAKQPVHKGQNKIMEGLYRAAQDGLIGSRALEDVHPNAVQTYTDRLVGLGMFPNPETGEWELPEDRRPARRANVQLPDGTFGMRVEATHHLDVDEVALLLALANPDQPVRTGTMKVRESVQRAYIDRLAHNTHRRSKVDKDLVAGYREALIDAGIYPAPTS